jgi:hypothetical protein
MKQATFWTAAAAAVSFGVAGADAAPRTFDIQFTPNEPDGFGSFGTGFFTIDDTNLTPNAVLDNPALILDFEANFTNVPGFGNLSYDEGDLNALLLKTDPSSQITGVSFGTTSNGTDPFLVASIFSTTFIDTDPNDFDPGIAYNTTIVPEPGSLALLAAGAAALPLIRRRRAKRADA